jgi:DNA-directed RNA polymerase sigma subunit (sigma70/sigma32)
MFTLTENLLDRAIAKGVSERNIMIVLDRCRGVPLAHIAKDEGLSTERIRQIEAKVLRTLTQISARSA